MLSERQETRKIFICYFITHGYWGKKKPLMINFESRNQSGCGQTCPVLLSLSIREMLPSHCKSQRKGHSDGCAAWSLHFFKWNFPTLGWLVPNFTSLYTALDFLSQWLCLVLDQINGGHQATFWCSCLSSDAVLYTHVEERSCSVTSPLSNLSITPELNGYLKKGMLIEWLCSGDIDLIKIHILLPSQMFLLKALAIFLSLSILTC